MFYISVMREVNLRSLDLNLLVLLDALIEHCNVTRAAEGMSMSQPAMSRALARLRRMLNDPILVRGADGLVATPRAIALQPQLKRLLSEIINLVSDVPFDPKQLTGCVTLAATEHHLIVLLPGLMARLSQEAPQLDVKVVPLFNIAAERLHNGSIDLAFGVAQADLPSNLCQESLYQDFYVTLLRRGHPIGDRLSIEQFVSLKHVLVTAIGDGRGLIDTALDEMGLKRRIVLQLPSFFTALAIVAQSDFVVTLPASITQRYAVQHNLVAIAPPVAYPPITHISIWSEIVNADPANHWLRNLVREEANQIETALPFKPALILL